MEKEKRQIFIGGAWPYANNSMHLGHLVALLPGDIIAKYFRQCGDEVIYVAGSDCHGTPITVRASKLNIDPSVIAEHYHKEFTETFNKLGFQYDVYSATYRDEHKQVVQDIVKKIGKNGYLFEREEEEYFCETCNKYIADREIIGICPECGGEANGDQCDSCLTYLSPIMLLNPKCKKCGCIPTKKMNKHLYFNLPALLAEVKEYVDNNSKSWRQTAINESNKYINEGLRERAITRQLTWGVPVPFDGFEDKRFYVWIEAVLGYISAGIEAGKNKGIDFDEFIKSDKTICYYAHGKDNIVFHTIILPALLIALKENYCLPNQIVSCEYMNLNEQKMSKSKGNFITIRTLIANFDADSIRYYFTYFNPERKDSSFALDDFVNLHNKHLAGGLGNFVNRNLSFLIKKFDGKLPNLKLDSDVEAKVKEAYEIMAKEFEVGNIKEACEQFHSLIQFANKYYDENTPWVLANENIEKFNEVTSNCIYLIANLGNLCNPIMPETSKKICDLLGVKNDRWTPIKFADNLTISEAPILFNKYDIKEVDLTKGLEDTLAIELAKKQN